MTEHPILFSAPMIRAILDGRKTVTRRVIKANYQSIEERDDGSSWPWREDLDHAEDHWYPCPYGKPGDTLWVRETWAHVPTRDTVNHVERSGTLYTSRHCIYCADDPKLPALCFGKDGFLPFVWSPSIFMPRWASRITLCIKSVRVERLQNISEADCFAEGAMQWPSPEPEARGSPLSVRYSFRMLWDRVNANRGHGYETNPWVWVVEFERLAEPEK